MVMEREEYYIGDGEFIIDGIDGLMFEVCYEPDEMSNENHVNLWSGEYYDELVKDVIHKHLGTIEFKDPENLRLFQTGLYLMNRAIDDELK